MTRKEQIRQAGIEYTYRNRPMCIGGGSFSEMVDEMNRNKPFEEGAKWADENPNKKLVYTKKELLDMGFTFDLNGNISVPQEIEEKTKKYINYQKDKWIKKACEWFIGEFSQMQDRDGHPNVESRSCVSVEELIQDFRKVMEE